MRRIFTAALLVASTSQGGGCAPDVNYYESPPQDPFAPTVGGGRDGGEPFRFEADFGPIAEASPAPKPISGGTIAIDEARDVIAVGDPDRDLLHLVTLSDPTHRRTIELVRGDDPGRAAFVPGGDLFVVLRGGGALAAVDTASGTTRFRIPVCPSPRGLAFDPDTGRLLVACVGGQLLRIDPTGRAPITSTFVAPDLRDVVVENGRTWLSVFRSAEILRLNEGLPPTVFRLPALELRSQMVPLVAYRMIPAAEGGVLVLHQYATTAEVDISRPDGAYGGDFNEPPVGTGVTLVTPDGTINRSGLIFDGAMSVDIAERASAGQLVVAQPGASTLFGSMYQITRDLFPEVLFANVRLPLYSADQATAVATTSAGQLVAFSREPPRLTVGEQTVRLPGASALHTGHEMFHRVQLAGLACASCHPEGRDDGHVWNFSGLGPRRSQSSRGLAGTAPFHWDGDMADLGHLLGEVMGRRMGAGHIDAQQTGLLSRWLDTLEPLRTARLDDTATIERGRQLFEAVGCVNCHVGPALTNNATVDVGTGGAFQVPSLRGVGSRAPFMHDGCATTLRERFVPACGGGDRHGATSGLGAAEIDDLVAYLETL